MELISIVYVGSYGSELVGRLAEQRRVRLLSGARLSVSRALVLGVRRLRRLVMMGSRRRLAVGLRPARRCRRGLPHLLLARTRLRMRRRRRRRLLPTRQATVQVPPKRCIVLLPLECGNRLYLEPLGPLPVSSVHSGFNTSVTHLTVVMVQALMELIYPLVQIPQPIDVCQLKRDARVAIEDPGKEEKEQDREAMRHVALYR